MAEIENSDGGLAARYYRSFGSYAIPFQPEGEVGFAGTEGLRSYYIGRHDGAGRLVRFAKILLERERAADVELAADAEPGSILYAGPEWARGPRATVARPIDYVDTEPMAAYSEILVGPSGHDGHATLYRRRQVFEDTYIYRPDGGLRTRIQHRDARPTLIRHYDESGHSAEERETLAAPDAGGPYLGPDPSHALGGVPEMVPADAAVEPPAAGPVFGVERLTVTGTSAGALVAEIYQSMVRAKIPGSQIFPAGAHPAVEFARTAPPTVGADLSALVESAYRSYVTAPTPAADRVVTLHVRGRHAVIRPGQFDRAMIAALFADDLT